MNSLNKKTTTVSRSLNYTYYISPPNNSDGITVLCVHGWPDDGTEWAELAVSHLIPAGYGVLSIDCLGYGGTSKPTDPALYHSQAMAKDVIDILDEEKLAKVVSLGHDWGCFLAQRVYHYHPDRVLGLALINVAYMPPLSQPFDLDAANETSKKFFGYGNRYYWYLFGSKDGYKLLDDHIESLFTLLHGEPYNGSESLWLDTLCKPDGTKNYLLEDKRQPLQPYATETMRNTFVARMKRDGFQAPLCWYRAICEGFQDDESKKTSTTVADVPTLFVAFDKDVVCRPEAIQPSIKAGLLPKLTTVQLEGSHWGLHSNAKQFGDAVVDWLKKEI